MYNFLRTLYLCLPSFVVLFDLVMLQDPIDDPYTNQPNFENPSSPNTLTEHPGGIIVNKKIVFSKSQSPYWLRNDIIVERNAELVIEAGVTIKVDPQVGITVRGILTAEVSNEKQINYNDSVMLLGLSTIDLFSDGTIGKITCS